MSSRTDEPQLLGTAHADARGPTEAVEEVDELHDLSAHHAAEKHHALDAERARLRRRVFLFRLERDAERAVHHVLRARHQAHEIRLDGVELGAPLARLLGGEADEEDGVRAEAPLGHAAGRILRFRVHLREIAEASDHRATRACALGRRGDVVTRMTTRRGPGDATGRARGGRPRGGGGDESRGVRERGHDSEARRAWMWPRARLPPRHTPPKPSRSTTRPSSRGSERHAREN